MKERIEALFAQNPKISIAQICKELGAKEIDVLLNLPERYGKSTGGDKFCEVIRELEGWGEVLFVKNTPSFIIEFKTKIPSGKSAQGFYNFGMGANGDEAHGLGILGGHLKTDEIDKIILVTQTFMGMLSKFVGFYDKAGENIFKIYVSRDEKGQLLAEQDAKFEALKAAI